jgi:hypothetical protein
MTDTASLFVRGVSASVRRRTPSGCGVERGWDDEAVATRVTSPVLIGRVGEQARLQGALRSVGVGPPTTVLIAGKAGIAKTWLVADFATRSAEKATLGKGAGCSGSFYGD